MKRSRPTNRRCGGFTLIELMIVVAILGLLAAILVPAVAGFSDYSKQEATKVAMNKVSQALQFYRDDKGKFPGKLQDLSNEKSKKTKENYLKVVPKDGWGNEFFYAKKENGRDFELISYGSDRMRGGVEFEADIRATKSGIDEPKDE